MGLLLSEGNGSHKKDYEELIVKEFRAGLCSRFVFSSDIYNVLFKGDDLVKTEG